MVMYSIRESRDGSWRVCRSGFVLLRGLRLAEAIRLAGEAARDEFRRSGRATTVEMSGPPGVEPILLACNELADPLPRNRVA